eukprot:gnl/Spiro4/596_TR342_c0_g1_i1.p1 gnl/Spiro4/596_TR342_c0_g1~~gnl/Spiro4/596_TR342_c0_g1_i1.p1  ORF type:complete len:124 (+),score=6.68 gnl/Spiro4/596_TR342_c0_g1_i1:143-514(+)
MSGLFLRFKRARLRFKAEVDRWKSSSPLLQRLNITYTRDWLHFLQRTLVVCTGLAVGSKIIFHLYKPDLTLPIWEIVLPATYEKMTDRELKEIMQNRVYRDDACLGRPLNDVALRYYRRWGRA